MTDLSFCPRIHRFVCQHAARCGAAKLSLRASALSRVQDAYVIHATCRCGSREREDLRPAELEAWLRAHPPVQGAA